jgi:adenosylcobinamide-phosphate synthase
VLTSRSTLATAGLLLGYGLDRLLGDPRRAHPVAAFGRAAGSLEARLYADRRASGVAYVILLVGAAAGLARVIERRVRRHPLAHTAVVALATWAVLGGRSLEREASTVDSQLALGDLAAAREQITHLVGRDPSGLDAAELARACVESVAENTSDAVVAPLFWGAVAGLPGLLGYRAANTLDAMVGHRSPRYRRFGWAAARLDDLLNWIPARCTGLLVAALGEDPAAALRAIRRDAGEHPSPNAGVVEAAFAGALGLRLGGVNRYGGVIEDRGYLGTGRPPQLADIARSTALARRIGLVAALLATLSRFLLEAAAVSFRRQLPGNGGPRR